MKYSVIIPVYNAEKTLRRCVDSLLEQNFTDVEIILVNDGSLDSSGGICEEYARNHKAVHYISQQNAGVSAARNAGLDAAQGEYILFVDSDDYVLPNYLSTVDRTVGICCADWILFSCYFENKTGKHRHICKAVSDSSREQLLPHVIDAICRKLINSPWAKLFRRDIIETNHIRFPVGVSVGEDRAFNIVYSFYIRSYAVSQEIVYVMNTDNENSLSRKHSRDLQQQLNTAEEFICRELSAAPIPDQEKEHYVRALNYCNCVGIFRDAKILIRDHVGWRARQKRLKLLCGEINRKHMRYSNGVYCMLTVLPVRLCLTPVIDAMAWVLMNEGTGPHRERS